MTDPRFSIVEPYWERAEALRVQLESFRKVYGDRDDWELVIVDDGSPTEPARPVVAEFLDLPINLIVNPMRQPGDTKDPCVPMNQAAAAAKSDMLVLSQADIEHKSATVCMLLDLFETIPNDKVVMYPCVLDAMYPNADKWRCNQFTPLPTTDCTLLRKEHFFAVGGFFEGYRDGYACSDTDFMRGLLEDDAVFVVTPNALVVHRGDICEQWREAQGDDSHRWETNLEMLKERRGPFVTFITHPIPVRTQGGGQIMPIMITADMVEKDQGVVT